MTQTESDRIGSDRNGAMMNIIDTTKPFDMGLFVLFVCNG